ncbi:hypothetical protein SAMN04489726_2679 [Allokutzneria albata]|uniref:Uncharacterized protein n=1 Tax=Allokutzneria albata TaxID=211114 RepID=A0A1G9UWR2_ALLAB|nr:hypothetical protein SAMN04489726_2679 [Allokutzneria albata]
MRKSLLALAILPIAGALATIGVGTASATSSEAKSAVHQLANCAPIKLLGEGGAVGLCYDIAYRVGIRCDLHGGGWRVYYSAWSPPNNGGAGVYCQDYPESTGKGSNAAYDLPD